MDKPPLLLIDGSSLIHKLFHALPDPGAVPSQLRRWLKLLEARISPSDVRIAMDLPGENWRGNLCPEYKANRAEKPSALVELLRSAEDYLCGYSVLCAEGHEADDLIATWAWDAHMSGDCRVVIVSSDKDLYQCLRHNQTVILRSFRTFGGQIKNIDWFNYQAFVDRYQIQPPQWPHYRALVGDSSDNLKGVPGIGDISATELLLKFATVSEAVEAVKSFRPVPLTDRQCKDLKATYASGALAEWVCVHTLNRRIPAGDWRPYGSMEASA